MLRLQNRGLGARFPYRALAPHRDDQSTAVTRYSTGDCLEKSFEHTHFPDTTLHIHRSQGASARKIRRQRYHAPRPQIPPVRLGNEILVGTFGITFTSSLSFKSVYQKYPPIVRFIFCGTPHDQVIDRGLLPFKVVNQVGFRDSHRDIASCRSSRRSTQVAILISIQSYSSMKTRVVISVDVFIIYETWQVSKLVSAARRLPFYVLHRPRLQCPSTRHAPRREQAIGLRRRDRRRIPRTNRKLTQFLPRLYSLSKPVVVIV